MSPNQRSAKRAPGPHRTDKNLVNGRCGRQSVDTWDEEPNREIRLEIVRRQLRLWQNTLYEAKVQARVAGFIDNDALAAAAAQNVEQAIRAIDELAALLDELLELDIIVDEDIDEFREFGPGPGNEAAVGAVPEDDD